MIDPGLYVVAVVPPPWYMTSWGQFGIFMVSFGLVAGIVIGWSIHKNRDLLKRVIFD